MGGVPELSTILNFFFKMMELMPGSGVYVYAKDIRIASKKASGNAIARYLMSAFYTNHELVERGNFSGKNGKQGLDPSTVKAIVGKKQKV